MNEINFNEKIFITDELSVINARHIVLKHIREMKFNIIDQTKIITATSELTRNIERYARKGVVYIDHINANGKMGLKLTFEDCGPGIEDIELAMKDGYSTSGGLGLGLPGTKRLMDEFQIRSQIGKGTKVTVVKWVG